ncbi:MAG: thioredoxin-dependent thiol peroxidase [Nitrospirota bacterium]|nr:MAG: thioredoxin-dependent thiol peroxidase [Nitrospirota bacterium]
MKQSASRSTSKKNNPTSKAKKTISSQKATKTTGLKVGQNAPPFTLLDDSGQKVSLSDFKGKKVVLYFYPKDDTPGCTKEACAFRDGIDDLRDSRAVVLGISADSVESHKKFSTKYDLNFPLLSDVDKKALQAYGVWKEKSLYGRKFMGIERTTYVIDVEGKIAHIFPKVKVDAHLEDVLGELELLS